ncbi:MAG: hypothetical protein ABI724_15840 [Betaproteobacteria bacterium]
MKRQNCVRRTMLLVALALAALATTGCETESIAEPGGRPVAQRVLVSGAASRAVEDRILALDPERVTASDVRDTLALGPTPQIMLMHGGIVGVYLAMISTGKFLVAMGYPQDRIRHPGDGRWSHSPYENSAHIAGLLAWYYERDGMRPMMIGHSQGGVQSVKVLYELAGQLDNPLHVWNPYTDSAEERTKILDPLTGKERPVIGVSASYVSGLDSGGIMMILPNQWKMLDKLRNIPDTAVAFTGYTIGVDFWPWPIPGFEGSAPFVAMGNTTIRNVVLPMTYDHVNAPYILPVADIPAARDWLDAYHPDKLMAHLPPETEEFAMFWAGDIWYSVKKYWTLEAQRLIRAKRNSPPAH